MANTSTHIQFGDEIHPVASANGGVFDLRSRSVTGVGSFHRRSSTQLPTVKDVEADSDEASIDSRDLKKKQTFTGWKLLWLAYQATGVVYGDIGTSPLYVYSSTFSSNPSYDDLLGALSLIIWTLTLMVSIKYCCIVLYADDEGEGGTFALYSLLSRYAKIARRDPREQLAVRMERIKTGDMRRTAKTIRNAMETSKVLQWVLRLTGVCGVALVMADGVLTPAQSVLGAIQGLNVVTTVSNGTVIGISCAILVALFLIQPFGTTKLASSFAPIVIIWLLFNAVFGIYNLARHDHSVLKAFSPYFAGAYLVRNGTSGWYSLGGILLAFTGCEALFADLGAFTQRAVSLSWLCFAFPCLLLGYIGQAAFISRDPAAFSNPFFATVPPGTFWPSFIIAILAAVVASQAMITAVFQLLTQIMKLSYFPQIKTVHTSKIFYGQIYIPMANWLLMIGTVVITGVYSNTTRLGHAYGVCVVLVTFITTNMVALVAIIVWRLPIYLVAPVWLVFALLDATYLSSALTKVPTGAWFTLALAFILATIFIFWRFGKEQQWRAEGSDRFPPHQMLEVDSDGNTKLSSAFGGHPIMTTDGIGVFFDKSGLASSTPIAFSQFLQKFHAGASVNIFFHLRPLQFPTVPADERYSIAPCFATYSSKGGSGEDNTTTPATEAGGIILPMRVPLPNTYRVTIRHGYNDEIITTDLAGLLYEQLRSHVTREGVHVAYPRPATSIESGSNPSDSSNVDEKQIPVLTTTYEQSALSAKLNELQRAYESQVVYVVGKEQLRVRRSGWRQWPRRIVLEMFIWVRENTRTKVQALRLPGDKIVEVGFVKEI